jgi:hypothetical protein
MLGEKRERWRNGKWVGIIYFILNEEKRFIYFIFGLKKLRYEKHSFVFGVLKFDFVMIEINFG